MSPIGKIEHRGHVFLSKYTLPVLYYYNTTSLTTTATTTTTTTTITSITSITTSTATSTTTSPATTTTSTTSYNTTSNFTATTTTTTYSTTTTTIIILTTTTTSTTNITYSTTTTTTTTTSTITTATVTTTTCIITTATSITTTSITISSIRIQGTPDWHLAKASSWTTPGAFKLSVPHHFETCLSAACLSPPPPDKKCPLEKVRQIGRDVRHTGDCKVTDADLQYFYLTLTTLLADPVRLLHDTSATEARRKLSDMAGNPHPLVEECLQLSRGPLDKGFPRPDMSKLALCWQQKLALNREGIRGGLRQSLGAHQMSEELHQISRPPERQLEMGTDQWETMSQNDKQQKVMILDNQAVEQIQKGWHIAVELSISVSHMQHPNLSLCHKPCYRVPVCLFGSHRQPKKPSKLPVDREHFPVFSKGGYHQPIICQQVKVIRVFQIPTSQWMIDVSANQDLFVAIPQILLLVELKIKVQILVEVLVSHYGLMSHGVGAGKNPSANKIAPSVAVYAIVMNARNEKLPAWHRLTTVVSIKGHLVDSIAQLGSFSTSFTMPSLGTLSPEKFFPNGHHRDTLTNTYCVLLGRILAEFKDFSWLQKLPIILKNEAKHEDCIDILDQYQQVLGDVYMNAFVTEGFTD
ncbi:hypothetical protein DPMN_172214, partial [Dreissena polymorpha]